MTFTFSFNDTLIICNAILDLVEPMWVLIAAGYVVRFVNYAFPKNADKKKKEEK